MTFKKKELDTYRPLSKDQALALKEHFKIGLTYSSNALEGNTLTLIETKVIIEDGLTIGGKSLREIDEATGHARAYDFIFELLGNPLITLTDILKIHHLFIKILILRTPKNIKLKKYLFQVWMLPYQDQNKLVF